MRNRFRMVAIPSHLEVGDNFLAFDPKEMQASYDAGDKLGRSADPWSKTPPSYGDLAPWTYKSVKPL
jgi:hypothetical protein